jgi:hypothetical protein
MRVATQITMIEKCFKDKLVTIYLSHITDDLTKEHKSIFPSSIFPKNKNNFFIKFQC